MPVCVCVRIMSHTGNFWYSFRCVMIIMITLVYFIFFLNSQNNDDDQDDNNFSQSTGGIHLKVLKIPFFTNSLLNRLKILCLENE